MADPSNKFAEEGSESFTRPVVGQPAGGVEFLAGLSDQDFRLQHHWAVREDEGLPELTLAPRRPSQPRRRHDDTQRLPVEDVAPGRP
jgi:hypothetical protein